MPGDGARALSRWTWSAGVVPAWRVDGVVRDLLALDEQRGLAIAGRTLYAIALDTGVVTVQANFDKGLPAVLVHAGGRVLGYGTVGKQAAVWTIDPATLAVARVELPGPAAGAATKGSAAIAVSVRRRVKARPQPRRLPTSLTTRPASEVA
ncbi:MAG: hypothetical protein F9K40_09070 [Kofleriaceae bacterium]|nr:MAG: hypothetical protein F9K40_09070 [Kofleriaceae bacterium]